MALKYQHTILLLDDEKQIINSLSRLFHKEKYHILTASSGDEALGIMKSRDKPISLIVSDQRMPGMNGACFLEQARKISPHTMRFLLTGYTDMDALTDAVNKGQIHRYFTKPWNDAELLAQARQSLEYFELTVENRRLLSLLNKQNKELKELNSTLEEKVEERSQEILSKNQELSRLNNELEAGLYNTVRAFGSLAEMHAPALAGHGRRVGLLSREIAIAMKLSDQETTHIEIAGILHDLGKLGFPARILESGEGDRTPDEEKLFRKHPEEGQSIVRFINRLDHVGLLIRSHHERVNGKGYPDRLSDEVIPLGSKIIAVADAYDKIANTNLERKKWVDEYRRAQEFVRSDLLEEVTAQQAALFHLTRHAETRYDPVVVQAFLDILNDKGVRYQNEKQVSVLELKEGMTITRSIYTGKGRFLLPHKTVLTVDLIRKLRLLDDAQPILEKIWVKEE